MNSEATVARQVMNVVHQALEEDIAKEPAFIAASCKFRKELERLFPGDVEKQEAIEGAACFYSLELEEIAFAKGMEVGVQFIIGLDKQLNPFSKEESA